MAECILSIIVPVYNVELYLQKCIERLLKQNIDNYEIILINDGSTDNSYSICLEYEKKYPEKIKCYSKDNSGLSDTRNLGVNKASGNYVCFMDSDDYIDENSLSYFISIMNEKRSDIIYFGYYYEKKDYIQKKYTYKSLANKNYTSNEFMKNELKKRNLPIPACFAFYKKELIINNNLYFESGMLHEDERWSPQIILNSSSIFVTDKVIYHYVQREGSITHKKDKTKNGLDLLDTAYYLLNISNELKDTELKRLFKNRISMIYMKAIVIGSLYRKEYVKKIDRSFPLKNTCFFKDIIKAILFFFNLRLYCYLNKKVKGD